MSTLSFAGEQIHRYAAPRFHVPIVVEEHVRALPPGATCKGLFFHDLIDQLRKAAPNSSILLPGGLGAQRYVHFFDYPYADYMRMLHATAQAVFPGVPVGEGLRRLGRKTYVALLNSQIGRVIFGVLGDDFLSVIKLGVRGYQVSMNFGRLDTEVIENEHIRYYFRNLPAYLETFQVGVVEGAMQACNVEGRVHVSMTSLSTASFDIRWWLPGQRPASVD
jgi:uncharacterized protein (TIGR02265 family)